MMVRILAGSALGLVLGIAAGCCCDDSHSACEPCQVNHCQPACGPSGGPSGGAVRYAPGPGAPEYHLDPGAPPPAPPAAPFEIAPEPTYDM